MLVGADLSRYRLMSPDDEIEFIRTPDGLGYTRHQHPGAMPNGTRIRKSVFEKNDTHRIGALGTVVGSFKDPDQEPTMYFVEWDDMPGIPVGVLSTKIEAADAKAS